MQSLCKVEGCENSQFGNSGFCLLCQDKGTLTSFYRMMQEVRNEIQQETKKET